MKQLSCALLAIVSSTFAADKPAAPNLDWISGHWCSESAKEHIDEWWMPASAGVLMGMSRTTRGERVSSFEFMRILLDPVPTLMAQPGGKSPAVPFKKVDGGDGWVRFENREHDFPQQIEYRRTGNHLHAHIAGPGDDGKALKIPYEYELCKN